MTLSVSTHAALPSLGTGLDSSWIWTTFWSKSMAIVTRESWRAMMLRLSVTCWTVQIAPVISVSWRIDSTLATTGSALG